MDRTKLDAGRVAAPWLHGVHETWSLHVRPGDEPAAGHPAGEGVGARDARSAPGGNTLAALAHELRTPLASITTSAALLQRALPPSADDDARLAVAMIVREARRAATLLSDFLSLARPRLPRRVPTDLNRLALEAVEIARQSRPEVQRATVELDLAEGLPPAPVDPDQLTQVLVNLVVNAFDACTDAGRAPQAPPGPVDAGPRVTVRTGRPAGADGWAITVRDTGPGIDPEARPRLFDPFFTRKANGTGLGLAISRRLVEGHRGWIEVDSRPGAGAAFTVVLPALAGPWPARAMRGPDEK